LSITAGPDGNLWFTDAGLWIGKITPFGEATEYGHIRIDRRITLGAPGVDHLQDITAGPDGNLWFTVIEGRIGKITPAGVITEYISDDDYLLPTSGTRLTFGTLAALARGSNPVQRMEFRGYHLSEYDH
jgi:hypothetical protein